MFDLLQVRKRKVSGALLGYNFDKLQSTGKNTINPSKDLSSLQVATPVTVPGYSKCIWLQSSGWSFNPFDFIGDIKTDDFTLEFRMYTNMTNTNSYQGLLSIPLANSRTLGIQFGDSGFGYRLQVYLNPNAQSTIYAAPYTKQSFSNGKFRHVAIVRRSGQLRVYIDGANNGLAQGTSTSYADNQAAADSVTGVTGFNMGGTTGASIYMTDILLTAGAKYTANFTPPVGPLA